MKLDLPLLLSALRRFAPEWLAGSDLPALSLHLFDAVQSTNRTLWELLDSGAPAGTIVIARQQQAGRGQRGKQWQSPPGGLYLSIALCPEIPAAIAAQLTLCSAWGIAAALRAHGVPVQLKWLNDLILESGKLGGILTETRVQRGQVTQAVVGVGVNWQHPVPPPGVTLQSQLDQQASPTLTSLETLAAVVIWGVLMGYQRWQQVGIEAILTDYQALFAHLGQQVAIDQQRGQIVGVTATGDLRVQLLDPNPTEICLAPGTISLGYGRSSYLHKLE